MKFLRAATEKESASIDAEPPMGRTARAILDEIYVVRTDEEDFMDPYSSRSCQCPISTLINRNQD